jgi:hypothetical protein
MEYSSGRVFTMLLETRTGEQQIAPAGMRRVVLAALAVTIAWLSTAHADDILDRGVQFQIAASPLPSALIQFSNQSGLKVAAADEDVARLNSNGLNGTYPVHTALTMLLNGTGLSFAPVGAQTVAIRSASTGPAVGALPTGSQSDVAGGTAAASAGQPDSKSTAGVSPEFPDVNEMAPRPPAEQELAGDSLRQFVAHHATVHYVNTGARGNLAHWRGGKQSICPSASGLSPAYNAFVTARIRALAANVGAPLQTDPQCTQNVRIFFTTDPQQIMTNVVKWASIYFRPRGGFARMQHLLTFTEDHAIQGWYITTRGGARALNTDLGLLPLVLNPLWPRITPSALADDGDQSGIGSVVMVVDTRKVAGFAIGTIADYVGMLSLTVAQSPDHCDPLPSILDVMASNCGRERPTVVTAGDLAFLQSLYYRNTGWGPSPSRDDIEYDMLRRFKAAQSASR